MLNDEYKMIFSGIILRIGIFCGILGLTFFHGVAYIDLFIFNKLNKNDMKFIMASFMIMYTAFGICFYLAKRYYSFLNDLKNIKVLFIYLILPVCIAMYFVNDVYTNRNNTIYEK